MLLLAFYTGLMAGLGLFEFVSDAVYYTVMISVISVYPGDYWTRLAALCVHGETHVDRHVRVLYRTSRELTDRPN